MPEAFAAVALTAFAMGAAVSADRFCACGAQPGIRFRSFETEFESSQAVWEQLRQLTLHHVATAQPAHRGDQRRTGGCRMTEKRLCSSS